MKKKRKRAIVILSFIFIVIFLYVINYIFLSHTERGAFPKKYVYSKNETIGNLKSNIKQFETICNYIERFIEPVDEINDIEKVNNDYYINFTNTKVRIDDAEVIVSLNYCRKSLNIDNICVYNINQNEVIIFQTDKALFGFGNGILYSRTAVEIDNDSVALTYLKSITDNFYYFEMK